MVSKTPKFWYNTTTSGHIISALLSPVSCLYQVGHKLNLSSKQSYRPPIPVICIGNATAGGSGKTPTAIAVAELIKNHNISQTPYFLTRGYGGNETGPKVITVHDGSTEVGDEPLLLKNHAKTIVSKDRMAGAKKAHDLGATCIIMDDGLQNPSIVKSISLLVVNGKSGFGNKRTIPSGPLREPINTAFNRCDAVILIGNDEYGVEQLCPKTIPVIKASITSNTLNLDATRPYTAFAGLAQPEKFKDTLKEISLEVKDFHAYPDHYQYTKSDIEKLIDNAKNKKTTLITTEKDHVRIPEEYKKNIMTLPISLSWEDESEIVSLLKNTLTSFKT